MLHCCSCLPVFVKQVIVEAFHCFKFISLEQVKCFVQRCVCRVCSNNGIIHASIVVCAEHLRTCHFVCEAECSAVRYAWSTKFALFRCNKNYTVCGACTVYGSRGVFQYRNALHFAWVEVVESFGTKVLRYVSNLYVIRIDITVDNEQRLLCGRTNLA